MDTNNEILAILVIVLIMPLAVGAFMFCLSKIFDIILPWEKKK